MGLLLTLTVLSLTGCVSKTPVASSTSTQATQPPTNSLPVSTTSSTFTVDAGTADNANLSAAWLKIGQAAGFDAGNIRPDRLELDFAPGGSLLRLLIRCTLTAGDVTVSWDGNGGQPDQSVNLTVTVAKTQVISPERMDDSRVYSVLSALEAVGVKNMIAKLGLNPSGFYRVRMARDIGTVDGDILPNETAYLWQSSSFQELAPSDALRKVDSMYVRLAVIAFQPEPALGSPTTALAIARSCLFRHPDSRNDIPQQFLGNNERHSYRLQFFAAEDHRNQLCRLHTRSRQTRRCLESSRHPGHCRGH